MSVSTELPLPTEVDRLLRVSFDFDDYLALPEWHRAEYVDGHAIVSPSPTWQHQRVSRRLAHVIEEALPTLYLVEAVGLWTGERRGRIPDVLATSAPQDGSWVTGAPVLVAEVLSPSTRSEDTLRKSVEYLAAGIAQFWIVDLEHTTLTVLGHAGHEWDLLLTLDAERPSGSLTVGDHGALHLDLSTLLAP